jgi:hypothetical protein
MSDIDRLGAQPILSAGVAASLGNQHRIAPHGLG